MLPNMEHENYCKNIFFMLLCIQEEKSS